LDDLDDLASDKLARATETDELREAAKRKKKAEKKSAKKGAVLPGPKGLALRTEGPGRKDERTVRPTRKNDAAEAPRTGQKRAKNEARRTASPGRFLIVLIALAEMNH